jgi:hypothetical protein
MGRVRVDSLAGTALVFREGLACRVVTTALAVGGDGSIVSRLQHMLACVVRCRAAAAYLVGVASCMLVSL